MFESSRPPLGPAFLRARQMVWLLIPIAVLVGACGSKENAPGPAGPPGAGAPPPAEVGVVTVQLHKVGLTTELPGRLEASRVAQVRARAKGIVQKRLFREGSDVVAGQPLFQIDAAPYQAAHDGAKAALDRAQANLKHAEALVARNKSLRDSNFVSQQMYLDAQTAQQQALADVAASKAAMQLAQINLGYSHVVSPLSGRIGRALVTEGALVGQDEATELAVVQQIDPMYVNFTQSTGEVLRLRRALESGELTSNKDAASAAVSLILEDGSSYGPKGKLLFSDLTVDATSGQITLRAAVPNPKGLLLPGMYVRVRIEQAQAGEAVVLPQQAVMRSAQGDNVMVIGNDGKPSSRQVKIGTAENGKWVILEGLKTGEQVMVEGFQKLRGQAPVKAVPWQDEATAKAAASSASHVAATP